MSEPAFQKEIEDFLAELLKMARSLTWNKISDNCRFILTEIENRSINFLDRLRLDELKNDLKIPVTLDEMMPELHRLYHNFYDINLEIYRSRRKVTIVNILYYPKSALEEGHRKMVAHNKPMMHSKVSMPPWHTEGAKFDINWEHKPLRIRWEMFWLRQGSGL